METQPYTQTRLGLRENWKQFTLLVIINTFVGGMIGLERTLLPQLAEQEFGLVAKTALLSFIVVFGLTKAITSYLTGALSQSSRKKEFTGLWMVIRPACTIAADVRTQLELDYRG
jgi:hypothetical protein